MFDFGIGNLTKHKNFNSLKEKKIALVCHPASVTNDLKHSLDYLINDLKLNVSCIFSPQHGFFSEEQDNMIESSHATHPEYNIPIFSLYGDQRKPTDEQLDYFDVCLFDLQDIGGRVYTYITTLKYMMEACSKKNKILWVLDRPNPSLRAIEGNYLNVEQFESFVGAAKIPMRHGLTIAEMSKFFKELYQLDLELEISPCSFSSNYFSTPFNNSWNLSSNHWVSPSPNIPTLDCALAFPGTVLLEGTTISEGRGTTLPLLTVGYPGFKFNNFIQNIPKNLLNSTLFRPCSFKPTFQKHAQKLCSGFQFHFNYSNFKVNAFYPYRIIALLIKEYVKHNDINTIWNTHKYEYETKHLAIDYISGSDFLRKWIENKDSNFDELDHYLKQDELAWTELSQQFYIYH